MSTKKTYPFINLSWDDLREWAGSKIFERGKSYQQRKLVSKLTILDDGSLLAWVDGTHRYTTKVTIDENGLPESMCTCPYGYDCKHGVAVVLEYLEQIKKDKSVPKAAKDDERLLLLEEDRSDEDIYDDDSNDASCKEKSLLTNKTKSEIKAFLKDKTKEQLTELIYELAGKFPKMAQELTDRNQLSSGDAKTLISRLKKDIREITSEVGWQNYWEHEGYTPDYSQIRIKLETLLESGHPDEVLKLGKELIERGKQQIEESNDEGETATEIEECMPVIVKALEQSSMAQADKLAWAVDVVLKDDYDLLNVFEKYLEGIYSKTDWNILADQLFKQLEKMKSDDYHRNYARDRLSDWIIYALEQAGRDDEILPLCEAEAQKTGSYTRLVKCLISNKLYTDAQRWIEEGIRKTEKTLPGITSDLRNSLKEIWTAQKDWISVATMQTEEFVRNPSEITFTECQKANVKTKTWPKVREYLLLYLEKGQLPWKQKGWPLGKSDQATPDRLYRATFPMTNTLISISILEKQPDRVLFWYDQSQKNKRNWIDVGDDRIATVIKDYAPERSVSIWKKIAEGLINQAKPSEYEQAAKYLRKAEKVNKQLNKQAEWNQYLESLREKHSKKRRLIEILDQSDSKPIISK
jgi:uncharacterized Zn finger protein